MIQKYRKRKKFSTEELAALAQAIAGSYSTPPTTLNGGQTASPPRDRGASPEPKSAPGISFADFVRGLPLQTVQERGPALALVSALTRQPGGLAAIAGRLEIPPHRRPAWLRGIVERVPMIVGTAGAFPARDAAGRSSSSSRARCPSPSALTTRSHGS